MRARSRARVRKVPKAVLLILSKSADEGFQCVVDQREGVLCCTYREREPLITASRLIV